MNIVDMIKGQLTGPILDKLSASLGESEEKTKAAADVAAPSLLSALASLVSSGGAGAEALINALRNFDGESLDRLRTDIAEGDADRVRSRGGDILGSLLGGNLPALINILSKFAGVGAVALKSLLSYLAPLILSMIAEQMRGKSLTPASLGAFFDDQKPNIQAALPAGFSLASPPAAHAAPRAEASGTPGWLLPLVALALLGVAAWLFMSNQPEERVGGPIPTAPQGAPAPTEPEATADAKVAAPTADEVTKDLDEVYETATRQLTSVKDAATAHTAAPTLDGLLARLDDVKDLWKKLPPDAKEAVTKATAEHLSKFKALVGKTMELPGVGGGELKPILDALLARLSEFVAA